MIDPQRIRNVAIIAHVDHGKTSLLDGLLRDARVFRENQAVATCVMDQHDLERERGITIFSKACSIRWRDHRLNIIDTPGHADFGGEVERVLQMADAALVVVCAHDGPMPQTRFVLRKALAHGLRLVVVVNKVDRKDGRPEEVPEELFGLLIDIGADEDLLDSPVIYASAKEGRAAASLEAYPGATDLQALLDVIVDHVPAPVADPAGPLQLQVAQIDWDDYVGRIALGRLRRGVLRAGDRVLRVGPGGGAGEVEVKKMYQYQGLERVTVEEASAGDIVLLALPGDVDIGDTLCAPGHPDPLPVVRVDPPTVAMYFVATDSPFRGRDGDRITSRQLRVRLLREARANVALDVLDTDGTEQLEVRGRGLLHLGILIEEMRREGYEFCVSRPRVIEREGPSGERLEPLEDCVVDVAEDYQGKVIEILGGRRGELLRVSPHGDQVRLEFDVPSRGLIGIRAPLLNATAGEATIHHQLREYGPLRGSIPERATGVQVAMGTGRVTSYAVELLESRGQLFVEPSEEVYAGQVVGEHRRPEDLEVNICRKRGLTNIRSATAERKTVLAAPRAFGVEEALAYIASDELVELTPSHVRLRKRLLDPKARKRVAKAE